MKLFVLCLQDMKSTEITILRGFVSEDEARNYAHLNLKFNMKDKTYFIAEVPIEPEREKIIPVVMAETTQEWRSGFEFAIACLFDHSQYHVNKKENPVEKVLLSTKALITFNCFWPEKE